MKTRERWAGSRVSNARDKYMLHHACVVATQPAWEAKALVPLAIYLGFGCVVQTPLGGTGTSGNIMALRMAFAVTSDHEWLATAIRPQNRPSCGLRIPLFTYCGHINWSVTLSCTAHQCLRGGRRHAALLFADPFARALCLTVYARIHQERAVFRWHNSKAKLHTTLEPWRRGGERGESLRSTFNVQPRTFKRSAASPDRARALPAAMGRGEHLPSLRSRIHHAHPK